MRKTKILIITIFISTLLVGCGEYFKEESRIVVDYRHNEPYVLTRQTLDDGNIITNQSYQGESFELLWEITFEDGHKEREWHTCTRFEYNNAVLELGD